ncbi:MAG: adenylosuccinate lyase [bacterium]|nr:adenylosuccinate lyase [bacterium]
MDAAHDGFQSPFSWRYGSDAMRRLWSETHKRRLWRRIWVALAEAQHAAGLVSAAQVDDLRAHMGAVDLERAAAIEADIHHDLMAEVHTYAEQCAIGGGIIHLGATSMDIEDNADSARLRDALGLLIPRLETAIRLLADRIDAEADQVCMAFTHLQPAEPTTVGYRLALHGQDLTADLETLRRVRDGVKGKGIKGAVGTAASYAVLLDGTTMTPAQLEAHIMTALDLPAAYPITGQTAPRRQEWDVINALAGLALTAYKFAFDLRVLQSPAIGEWSEPFGAQQVGSSAMPFKRNPIHAENIDSLARYLAALPRTAWDNAAHNLLERTLDDSANRRTLLPEAFLTADELVARLTRLIKGLRIDRDAIRRNLARYGVFAATERLLMAAARAGGDRQALHAVLREHSLAAWDALQAEQPNPLAERLAGDARFGLPADTIRALLDASSYVGDAPERARRMAQTMRDTANGGRFVTEL